MIIFGEMRKHLLLTAILALVSMTAVKAEDHIRYVSNSGKYNQDGTSWATAKVNVQDAINDVKKNMKDGDRGYVFVAEGTYRPTQALPGSNGSTLYMSIQIPSGISVYGGFRTGSNAETGSTAEEIIAKRETIQTQVGSYMKHRTIFTGALAEESVFEWNESKHRFNTSFFGNCYHVIWFATNGYETDADGVNHYKALSQESVLDGVTIRDGYAYSSDINKIDHIAFGAGAYMVENSVMRNCEIMHCEASRGGGALYLDRGGKVENCYIHDCQSLGVNSTTGFGGGVAVDQKGLITHCAIINNVGRSGGGLSMSFDPEVGGNSYALCASACLVAQNISTAEAGGIYMNRGGMLNGMTIVNNRTYGTGVTLNGIVTGRSGGVYVRDHARLFNSVLWGNATTANNTNNLQYASSRSAAKENLKPSLTYMALSQADYTDWSGTKKVGICKLDAANEGNISNLAFKFAMFKTPCATVGHIVENDANLPMDSYNNYIQKYEWVPMSSSGLCYAGLQLLDIVISEGSDLSAGYLYSDLKGQDFSPKCALGAYSAEREIPMDVEINGVHTLFVDPNRNTGTALAEPGISWDSPLDNLTDALLYLKNKGYANAQIFVKQGTLSTASRYAEGNVRNTTIPMIDNVVVMGGYPSDLTGITLERRNPVAYPTIISGKVVDKDYQSNVAHLVTFDAVGNSVLDGFELRWGNALSDRIENYGTQGAGVLVKGNSDVTLRNITIADCTAATGAAIYQQSGVVNAENCIFRNNDSRTVDGAGHTVQIGATLFVYTGTMVINHCDIIRNVGYGATNYGRFEMTNSIGYANMSVPVEDTNRQEALGLAFLDNIGNLGGSYNLFDTKSPDTWFGPNILTWNFDVKSSTYPRFVNSTKNAGVSQDGDMTYYGRDVDYTPSDMNPAVNAASTGDIAHTARYTDVCWGKDMTTQANRDFGGLPDIGALENGAFSSSSATQPSYGTVYYVRDYHTYDSEGNRVAVDYGIQGRNGLSWNTAINGNGDYEYAGGTIKGLQYAVNTAHDDLGLQRSTRVVNERFGGNTKNVTHTLWNLTEGKTDAQVWVAAGVYTKSSGFLMRNHVKVYGGFPRVGNPGMLERHPQLTNDIPMSSENQTLGLNYRDYETILQTNESPYTFTGTVDRLPNSIDSFYEMTNGSEDLDGKIVIMTNQDRMMYFNGTGAGAHDVKLGNFNDIKGNPLGNYYYLRFSRVTNAGLDPDTYKDIHAVYSIQVMNQEGAYFFPEDVRGRNDENGYLNAYYPGNGVNKAFGISHEDKTYGEAENYGALWDVYYEPGQGYVIRNIYRMGINTSPYLSAQNNGFQDDTKRYWKLYCLGTSVLSQPEECRVSRYDAHNEPWDRVWYEGTEWDGFTIRNGHRFGVYQIGADGGRRSGGAGVMLYENTILRNCVVRDNVNGGRNAIGRGGGIYVDGSKIINCYLKDNVSTCQASGENYGGGMYMIYGTMYNTVIAGNRFTSDGGANIGNAVFFESAKFYNNTIVNNRGGISTIGVYSASKATSELTVYNSIIIDDHVKLLNLRDESTPTVFDHCFIKNPVAKPSYSRVEIKNSAEFFSNNNDNVNPFAIPYTQAKTDYNYRIKLPENSAYNCVNKGTELLGNDYDGQKVVLPSHDMDYTRRVQDCRVDIGAYEYNGADDIRPDTDPSRVPANTAVYYVSELGFGSTQAYDPANAACAEKLQKVLDAAGRYKYQHPDVRIIVKLAGVDATIQGYKESTCFKYYPCRTTDTQDDNVRAWSIMVPRGVEVWGGYCVDEVLDKTTNDDIARYYSEDERSVMYHPTILQTVYDNYTLNETIRGYHVVTFTDKTFDADGFERDGMTLSSQGVSDRAVLDGLFLMGGQADGESYSVNAQEVNVNQYGGAAVVTDYAHVRNCIIKDNQATYGGALAMMNDGLVSGCLIVDNSAEFGGGIYVVEDGVRMSGVTNMTTAQSGEARDERMPHVYTSTIVKNTGIQQGGGIWFSNDAEQPNVRVNSTVLWENISPDQANVAGQTSPDMPSSDNTISTFDWYPFAYSAVQNLRLSGVSNISVDIQNRQGNRFGVDSMTDSTKYDGKTIAKDTTQINYYGLTIFSALCRTGMPWTNYQELMEKEHLALADYNNWHRDTIPANASTRTYIDIGARAYPSTPVADLQHPFLRLFVAQTQDVDMNAYMAMQDYTTAAEPSDPNYIYSLLGSSFAYPFQNVDDALAYISALRSCDMWKDRANNMPFEICVARGDYFPQRDMQGNYGYSLSNTFLIPEGVTLMGGFDCNVLYGQYWKPDADRAANQYTSVIADNVIRFGSNELNKVGANVNDSHISSAILRQIPLEIMADERVREDLNMNNILEPWEFRDQTNFSGNAVNLQNSGVYHVVSVIPYAPGVGQLPKPSGTNEEYVSDQNNPKFGLQSRYIGQPVIIDGVYITDGYARDYVSGSLKDNGVYDYYRGGGIRANGNWYCEDIAGALNPEQDRMMHPGIYDAIAYRDIPLYIRNSQFINNQGGYGAAIDANVSTHIYNCLFAQNKAMNNAETAFDPFNSVSKTVTYPGNGGAIYFSKYLEAYNTIFSNNEAEDAVAETGGLRYTYCQNLKEDKTRQSGFFGAGGALCGGYHSRMKVVNCDLVNNMAAIYPAIYSKNPNVDLSVESNVVESGYNLVSNCVFWGNKANDKVKSGNPFAQGLCINYAKSSSSNGDILTLDNAPENQQDLDDNYTETVWFSGYEKGRARTAVNRNDFRQMPYSAESYIGKQLFDYWMSKYSRGRAIYQTQNANIVLSSINSSVDGPNFCNPSAFAGVKGYNEAADWSRARINNLTDNGSCFLSQEVADLGQSGYKASWQKDAQQKYIGDGIYYQAHYANSVNRVSVDLGDDDYMRSAVTEENLPRVASDPNPNQKIAYVDLGVYEYPYCKLKPTAVGDEVDILWVATNEKPENGNPDGHTWDTPTSDLQRAIETLLSSRNGHRKEIRLTDGEYTPLNTYGEYRAFHINTKELNGSVVFPDEAYVDGELLYDPENIQNYYVRSLVIKGGYSRDLRDQYNTTLYPAVLRSPERVDETSVATDYLFLVDDAVQRYGRGDLADDAYGAKAGEDGLVRTIPLQLDGITLINNQATPGTHGAALRYNDQVFHYSDSEGNDYISYASAPLEAEVSINQEEYDALKNQPGETVYRTFWTDETYTERSNTETDYTLYSRMVKNPAKLTLTKTCVMNSGSHYDEYTKDDYSSTAVYIGRYGGDALIYNSVFHSNWGNPLEAFNTRTINNTIALNHGRWILKNLGSVDDLYETGTGEGQWGGPMLAPRAEGNVRIDAADLRLLRESNIMNSILWRNNPVGTEVYDKQFSLSGFRSETDDYAKDHFVCNAYTCFIMNNRTKSIELDITEGNDYDTPEFRERYWNTHLSLDNTDIAHGPNFKAPKLEAMDDEIESRDFSLQPSVRIIDKGRDTIYAEQVFDLAWIPTTELDFINQSRIISQHIEVGAIEYPQPLRRVLYVDPNKPTNGSGENWNETMNSQNLQNAIDLAAIYSATKPMEKDANGDIIDRNEAYVFIKGSIDDAVLSGITLRSGVNVYGSIESGYIDGVNYEIDEETGEYRYPTIATDVKHIVNDRPGLVTPGTEQTILPSVRTGENDTFDPERPACIDGVVITAKSDKPDQDYNNPTGAISEPVLVVTPRSSVEDVLPTVAVSHVLVADNDASHTPGINVAEINNALIYEVLFRDNKTAENQYVLNFGSNAYGVNLTVEGRTNDAAGRCEYTTEDNKNGSHIWYSIYNYMGQEADENTLSSYNYRLSNPNLNYQLTELSWNIDRCPVVNPMDPAVSGESTANLKQFINYSTDIDLLGNPRVLRTSLPTDVNVALDRGAFETWRIGKLSAANTVYSNTDEDDYYGNFYPHEGSVVYLMANSNLISAAHELIPGYLLVKHGASLYGHGQSIKVAYVGVERPIDPKGTVVAVPYEMDYNYTSDTSHGPALYEYDANGILTLAPDLAAASYIYNGVKRAAARYQFRDVNSGCWSKVSRNADPVEACQGIMFTASDVEDMTLVPFRFTGRGADMQDYIYEENLIKNMTNSSKSVILTPYNNEPLNGFGHLTAEEDMGWNCFGIPYLVSEFKPYVSPSADGVNVGASANEYQMHLPKELWLYYDGVQSLTEFGTTNDWTTVDAKNYAGFYAAPSWESAAAKWHLTSTPALWVGEGIFAQTASYTDESLRFYLPIYAPAGSAAPARRQARYYVGAIEESVEAVETVEDSIYDLQGRQVQSPASRGLYIVNGKKVMK